ncbi:MAG: hypothetical protein ABJA37_08730 [Ferruginibacter sp.]
MKKNKIVQTAVLFAFVFTLHGCAKNREKPVCRTCTALNGSNIIATQDACSTQAEQDFKSQYYYAEVSCR